MKTQGIPPRLPVLVLAIAALLLQGCGSPQSGPAAQGGSDAYTDPRTGMDALRSYHVSFRQDVVGTADGQPFEYHAQVEMSRSAGQIDFTRELAGSETPGSYFRAVSDGQAVYRWFDALQDCQGEAGRLAPGELLEPAAILYGFTTGESLGPDVVNAIPTTRYRIDQDNLDVADPRPAIAGEVWIAEEGGYVVRLTLTFEAPSEPTGEGLEARQEWIYELSQINEIDSIGLPEGCLSVPMEIPIPSDAQEVTRTSGRLTFTTPSSAQDVLGFYFRELPALGWEAGQRSQEADAILPVSLSFARGDELLAVSIPATERGLLSVELLLYSANESSGAAAPASPLPSPPAAAAGPADDGLPDDVPLYPGVTDVTSMGGALTAASADPAESVLAFYLEQMPLQGWGLTQNIESAGATELSWEKQGRNIQIIVVSANGSAQLMIIQLSE